MDQKGRQIENFAGDTVDMLNKARKVLGKSAMVTKWLNTPQAALGNRTPASLMYTDEGAVQVMTELGRIEDFRSKAHTIAIRFRQIELNRYQEALRAFEELEKFDPELAQLASQALHGRGNAAAWLAAHIEASDIKTPWECIADGNLDWVRMVLSAVESGEQS